MGQKVNPKSYRITLNKDWDSRWITKVLYPYMLAADDIIRNTAYKMLGAKASVDKIIVERGQQENKIEILTSRPGIVIGRSGKGIQDLKKAIEHNILTSTVFRLINSNKPEKEIQDIKKKLASNIKITISEIREPELRSNLIAQDIANQLERRMPYRKVIKKTISKVMANRKVKGIKISVSGRLGGVDIARTEKFTEGTIPLSTLKTNISYSYIQAKTIQGTIGVKVWICIKDQK